MSDSEFSRPVKARALPAEPLSLTANAEERARLAQRFGLVSLDALIAQIALAPDGDAVIAEGNISARIVQTCAVSGEDFATDIKEGLQLRFVPQQSRPVEPDTEIEITSEQCDEVEFSGDTFDLGEAVAQTLGLAIDPYATGPDAERVRKEKGLAEEGSTGPLAEALAALRKD